MYHDEILDSKYNGRKNRYHIGELKKDYHFHIIIIIKRNKIKIF